MAWSSQVRRYIYILTLLFWILVFATIYSLKNENSYNYSNHELARYLSHMIIGCIVRELPRQCVRCVGPESEGSSTGKIRKRKLMLRVHSSYRVMRTGALSTRRRGEITFLSCRCFRIVSVRKSGNVKQ